MHRIDSATARQNANGTGKTGFHDNADLPNQDATYFTPEWANALQEEIAGVIEGLGLTLDKADNGQLLKVLVQQFGEKKVLEEAMAEYKEMIRADRLRLKALEAKTYDDTKVGELFWTTKHFLTPEEVTTYKGYGTWKRALQGRVAVGFSDIPDDHIDFRTHGKQYGEHEHMLTPGETPNHIHTFVNSYDGSDISSKSKDVHGWSGDIVAGSTIIKELAHSGDDTNDTAFLQKTKPMSHTQTPHNNIQPSQTIDCWQRVS